MYITRLKGGLTRIPNDPFDGRFWRIDHDNPAIWDNDRQSFIHNALPVPVHSHNDYWQRIPLFEALGSGCISVEADVHLRGSDLLVGHTASHIHSASTLRSMYLKPLQRMLEAQNANCTGGHWKGLFNRAPQQTFVLLVDLKSSGSETFAELHTQLQPLRDLDYLTYWNGTERVQRPLTVVASGTAPFQSVIALDPTHRDIFWDAKLERLVSIYDNFETEPVTFGYNRSNSYFASTEFKNAILHDRHWNVSLPVTPQMKDIMASQIEQAKARGLMARCWGTPAHPPNLREIAWRVLLEKQIDILSMDDMGIVRARANGWGKDQDVNR